MCAIRLKQRKRRVKRETKSAKGTKGQKGPKALFASFFRYATLLKVEFHRQLYRPVTRNKRRLLAKFAQRATEAAAIYG